MNPRVVSVKAKDDFILELVFENGQKKIFDMKPYLSKGIFRELTNPVLFKTVKPFMGSISWKNGQDLCPDTLYLESKKVYRSSGHALSVAESKISYGKKK